MEFEENSIIQHKLTSKYRYLRTRIDTDWGGEFDQEWWVGGGYLKDTTLKRWYKPVPFSQFKNAEFFKFIIRFSPCLDAFNWLIENQHKSLYDLWRTCPYGEWLEFILERIGLGVPGWNWEHTYSTTDIRKATPWQEVKLAFEREMERKFGDELPDM